MRHGAHLHIRDSGAVYAIMAVQDPGHRLAESSSRRRKACPAACVSPSRVVPTTFIATWAIGTCSEAESDAIRRPAGGGHPLGLVSGVPTDRQIVSTPDRGAWGLPPSGSSPSAELESGVRRGTERRRLAVEGHDGGDQSSEYM